MEQQNQQHKQSIKEKMEPKPPIKTNWKFLIGIVVLAILAVGGILLLKTMQPAPIESKLNACSIDNDCIIVADRDCCGESDTAINKQYEKEYYEQPRLKKLLEICRRSFCVATKLNSTSCVNNLCVLSAEQPIEMIDNSDWQTYRNDEFGFEVRHPREWTSLRHSSQSVEFHHPNNNPYISLVVFENIGGSEALRAAGITFCGAYPDQCTREKLSIGGVQTTIEWRLHDASINFGIPEKNYMISISFNSNFEKTSSEEMKLFLQILSTFRFIGE